MGELLGFARDLLFENELSRWVLALSTFLAVFTLLPLAKRRYQRLLRLSRFETAQIVSSIIASMRRRVLLNSRFTNQNGKRSENLSSTNLDGSSN